jgi:hypothetical protein
MPDRMLAEYATEDDAVAAIRRLHADGYRRIEAYMPFPSHEIDDALGHHPSRLPFVIFAVGICAAIGAYLLQWLLVAYLYPLVVGGRPPHFPLAFVIITFEMCVLFSGFTAFFGTLALGRLFRLNDAVQNTPGFVSATRDRFWLEVSAGDPAFDEERTRRALLESGAVHVGYAEAYA